MLSTANKHLNAESKTVNTQTVDGAAGNQTAAMKDLPEGGADVTGNEDAAVQTA